MLTNLNLEVNIIRNEGAKTIGESLKANRVLGYLDLSFNYIRDEGAISIGNTLKTNYLLT